MLNVCLKCDLPCVDVNKDFIFPRSTIDPSRIRLIMISESPPVDHSDYYYEHANGAFLKTTRIAFKDAGIDVLTYQDISNLGIYLTTAIKCSKKGYTVSANIIKECSRILGQEISQFQNIKVIMCMGDFAIKAINYITKRKYGRAAILSGSTYKIRNQSHILNNIRYFPSYTQTGESFDIEKSKRKMISEDLKKAISIL